MHACTSPHSQPSQTKWWFLKMKIPKMNSQNDMGVIKQQSKLFNKTHHDQALIASVQRNLYLRRGGQHDPWMKTIWWLLGMFGYVCSMYIFSITPSTLLQALAHDVLFLLSAGACTVSTASSGSWPHKQCSTHWLYTKSRGCRAKWTAQSGQHAKIKW